MVHEAAAVEVACGRFVVPQPQFRAQCPVLCQVRVPLQIKRNDWEAKPLVPVDQAAVVMEPQRDALLKGHLVASA